MKLLSWIVAKKTWSLHNQMDETLKKFLDNWDKIKSEYKPEHLWWDNPNVIWLHVTDNEEDYEGSQEQYGIDKNGIYRYEYQSHCSCNNYEDSSHIPDEFTANTKKSFMLENVDTDLDKIFKDAINELVEKYV